MHMATVKSIRRRRVHSTGSHSSTTYTHNIIMGQQIHIAAHSPLLLAGWWSLGLALYVGWMVEEPEAQLVPRELCCLRRSTAKSVLILKTKAATTIKCLYINRGQGDGTSRPTCKRAFNRGDPVICDSTGH